MFRLGLSALRAVARWYLLVLLAAVVSGEADVSASDAADGRALEIGDRRQVFIDGRFLDQARDVELVVHRPVKTNEITIAPELPWEGNHIGSYNSVLKTGDTYHLWYRVGLTMCYARSRDGIHWEKPALGLAEFNGSRDNNIVIGRGAGGVPDAGQGGMVFEDPNAPPEERLRMALREAAPGKAVNLLSSPNGIHWRLTHKAVLTYTATDERRHHLDSQNVIFWDDRIRKYVAYLRRNMRERGSQGRTIARTESDGLTGFLEAQESPLVLAADEMEPHLGEYDIVDYYTSATFKYPWAQDAYYMFPVAYFHYVPGEFSEFREEAPINAGPLDTRFAASRDGVHWQRFDRRPFVGTGMKGTFDSMEARVFYGMVPSVDGRELYLYYLGTDRLHGWGRENSNNNALLIQAGLQPVQDVSVISRLAIRRDGFISARAAYAGGEFTTCPLMFTGRRLVLNVDTSAAGIVQCELLDASGRPLEGFALADCDRIHTCNDVERVVTWGGRPDVSALAGRPVRIRFVYRDADLYAFQFKP